MSLEINKSYRSIMKATGVFGMMQVFRTIISIISSKVVAIYLGPIGIGLVSLLTNAVTIISAITSFEFLTVATREVALVSADDDKTKLNATISMLHKMAIFIGIFGAFVTFCFSSFLSNLTFGTNQKQHWFQLLAVYFLIISFTNARMAILQGVNKIKALAVCNIVAAFFIAIGTITIYYFYRIEGIIWVLLYASVVLLLVTMYFTRQYKITILPFNFKEFYLKSSPIFKFGFFMSINLILGQIANFCIKLYLNDSGASTQILGYYEVSSVLLINYLGLIFNAMAYDFYPKLTALSSDNFKVKELVNHQIEIALILITPAIILMYLVAPYLIEMLYSKAFLDTFIILKFALFSVILKAIVFPIGYIILVKGNKKIFFKQALFSDLLNFVLSIVLYKYYGLLGLGLAYLLNYLLYLTYVYAIVNKNYEFRFSNSCKKLIIICCLLGSIAVVAIYFLEVLYANISLLILATISILYSLRELNERINIKEIFKNRGKK